VPIELFPAFLLYALVCEITPGPVNLYALSAGLRYERRRLWGFLAGALTGFSIVMAVSVLLTLTIGEALGRYVGWLRYLGAAYILFLAFQMARGGGELSDREVDAPTFRTGCLLQVSNVKTILFCVTTLSVYVLPYTRAPLTLLLYGMALPVSGAACTAVWLLAGSVLRRFFQRWNRAVSLVLALLLALCAAQLAGLFT